MGETNSPLVAHVGYDISPISRAKLKILTTRLTVKIFNLTLLSGEISYGEWLIFFLGCPFLFALLAFSNVYLEKLAQ